MFKKYKEDEQEEELPWLEVLDRVEAMELWGGRKRETREPWCHYLTKADEILKMPRQTIPEDIVRTILSGDMGRADISGLLSAQPKVAVFVSSTFTDTKAERNQLMKDVYPFLRTLCRRLGVEFGTVDMRWGVPEEASSDHSTVRMCVQEIQRCLSESVGPAFLCLLGHKYGFRPLPSHIDHTEYQSMKSYLEKSGKDTSLIDSFYTLDDNAVPAEYVLKNKPSDDKQWWKDLPVIQEQFREASAACFGTTSPICDKYRLSVTETEIQYGAFSNKIADEQASFIRRNLNNYQSDFHLNRKIVDLSDGKLDEYALFMMRELREMKLSNTVADVPTFEINYVAAKVGAVSECIRIVCDHVCATLADNIMDSYQRRLHVQTDRVFLEVLQHRTHSLEKSALFVGREHEIRQILDYVGSHARYPLVIHGPSGCGKTALMALVSTKIKEQLKDAILVLRFLGTTSQSSSARLLLYNICCQISRVYEQSIEKIPTSYKDLVQYFRTCLSFATSNRPLVLVIDSLDQLSNEDFGLNLSWMSLSEQLPEHVKLVVYTLPVRTLDIIRSHLTSAECYVDVKPLTLHEGPEIVKLMLGAKHRKVTETQSTVILNAFKKCPFPLFLRLVVDLAQTWRSYDIISANDIADDMTGLIDKLFNRLEYKYGATLVQHALAYITASKNGLSLAELEDILSCDDAVLDSIFKFWVPPFRRIPPLLWTRVRNDLGLYLVERGSNGISAYWWYHRQFWETAEKRYLLKSKGENSEAFKRKAHVAIADYFEGKWSDGKPYVGKDKFEKIEDRTIPKQPLVISGTRDTKRQLNERKLTELPYHLIILKDWDKFKKLCMDLSYIEAKFEADDGYNCLSELIEATKQSRDEEIKQVTRFVGSFLGFLVREPRGVYQMALQQPPTSYIRKLIDDLDEDKCPTVLLSNLTEDKYEEPCEMSLHGHTGSVRCCDFSTNGDLLVSSADDSTMRIWDTTTGAELVTVSSLPEPIIPDPSENRQQLILHPVNPCCFSRTGDIIANGTELGDVILWDTAGVQLRHVRTDKRAVSSIKFSPDNKHIATAFKYGHLSIWDARDLTHVLSRDLDWSEVTGLDYSRDGTRLAVIVTKGLMLFETDKYSLLSRNQGTCLNLCCTFYPDGTKLMTGGDNSCVTVWDTATGKIQTCLSGIANKHNAWVWSIQFDSQGLHMFTCSSDRTMKIWYCETGSGWRVLKTVGGHSHRVSMACIEPGREAKILTASLDRSLKVWDVKTLIEGTIPPVKGGHFLVCVTSNSGSFLATSQGWSHTCNVIDPTTGTALGNSESHYGFIRAATFTPDSAYLLVLDHGHSGTYEHGAELNARARLVSLSPLATVGDLSVDAPASIAVSSRYLVVGSIHGEIGLFDCALRQVARHKLASGSHVTRLATHGETVAIGYDKSNDCTVMKIRNDTLVSVETLYDPDSACQTLEFSPDGRYLVFGAFSGKLYIWNASNTEFILCAVKQEHKSYVMDIKFSPSGNFMLSSAALDMRIWDVRNNFGLLCTYYAPVNCAAFLGDRQVLAGEATGNLKYLKF